MDVIEFAKEILNTSTYEGKLLHSDTIEFTSQSCGERVALPQRDKKIALTDKQVKFPKGHFHIPEKKAIALSSFANHELLATEIMAQMLLFLPHDTDEQKRFKRGIFSALKDEQKHLSLYVDRLNEIGYEFGDFPLNDYFWRQCTKISNSAQYLAIMAITFEGANLDFASLYRDIFKECEDYKTSGILNTVLKDEVSHVAFGVQWLSNWRRDKSLWAYYRECLPTPLTPARAKGKNFNEDARIKAKMDDSFISTLKEFNDDFRVTNRKEWNFE